MIGAQLADLVVAGERLVLLPERAVYREATGTLIVADTHWGKAATFRAGGIPVPRGTTLHGLHRLEAAVKRSGARRIIFLGDFLHARDGRAPGTLAALADWRARNPSLELTLVRGNHDRHAGDPPAALGIECVHAPLLEPPFAHVHHPAVWEGSYFLAGHIHPAVRLAGPGRQRERLPCFWFSRHGAVLPSFGEFTGHAPIAPEPGDRIFAVAAPDILEVPV